MQRVLIFGIGVGARIYLKIDDFAPFGGSIIGAQAFLDSE